MLDLPPTLHTSLIRVAHAGPRGLVLEQGITASEAAALASDGLAAVVGDDPARAVITPRGAAFSSRRAVA